MGFGSSNSNRFSRPGLSNKYPRRVRSNNTPLQSVDGPSGDGLLLNDGTSYVLLNDDCFLLLNG